MGYNSNREWSDRYIPTIKKIVGAYLLEESPEIIDMKEASDLVLVRAKNMMVACRLRRPGYLNYIHEFTIRSQVSGGGTTEFEKIVNGFGDWMFYGHADEGNGLEISNWHLIDLDAWRAQMIRNPNNIEHGEKANGDGTWFYYFDLRSFEDNPPILVDSCVQYQRCGMTFPKHEVSSE
jgi:hypothetical protein|tara:strand:+ start:149 stop:682 length:534 start_codon:yes stop_codon:yes gene_type:complete